MTERLSRLDQHALLVLSLLGLGLVMAWLLTGLVRRYALRTNLLDHPNARSSHSVPTPRGGGVAIVVACLLLTTLLGALGWIEAPLLWATLGAGGLVAVLGYLDDRSSLPARWRFAGHLAAALWVMAWLGPLPKVPLLGVAVDLGWAGPALSVLFLVWMINLFNFMDGIDGIAGVQTITTTLSGAWLWWLAGSGAGWLAAVVFAACVAGFLLWNFPPAKIFMGDAGSGFLGLMVALFALWSGQQQPALFWAWMILVGCFMVDATTTLVRRVRRGERFFEAHRSHAYQYASRRLGGHRPVTLAVGVINVVWLLPIAWAVAAAHLDGLIGVGLAYAPLVWLAFHFRAGDRAAQAA